MSQNEEKLSEKDQELSEVELEQAAGGMKARRVDEPTQDVEGGFSGRSGGNHQTHNPIF